MTNRKLNPAFIFLLCLICSSSFFISYSQKIDSSASLKSGIAQFHEGNFAGAEISLNKAAELNPKNPDAFFI